MNKIPFLSLLLTVSCFTVGHIGYVEPADEYRKAAGRTTLEHCTGTQVTETLDSFNEELKLSGDGDLRNVEIVNVSETCIKARELDN